MQTPPLVTDRIVTWTTAEEMAEGYPVVRQMYPAMSLEQYRQRLKTLEGLDYRQFAYMDGAGRCLGVVGLWFFPRIWCGLQADIDNFVVDEAARSMGIGKRLLDHCEQAARDRGAAVTVLDTFVDNPSSHRFYFREGYSIRGYHFVKPLQGQSLWNTH